MHAAAILGDIGWVEALRKDGWRIHHDVPERTVSVEVFGIRMITFAFENQNLPMSNADAVHEH